MTRLNEPPKNLKDYVIWYLEHQAKSNNKDLIRTMVEEAFDSYEEK